MAGDIKRQRKSWTLQDRSKVSINILRANLAEEGDEDAQLEVAKRLLLESSDPATPERTQNENTRLALYWLIKSSEQGNDEATHLLQECLQSGRGLTAQNILDVRACVTTPKDEKLTFKAARTLYRKLSNGEEFITTAQLLARVNLKSRAVAFESNGNGVAHQDMFPDEDNVDEQQIHEEIRENSTAADAGGIEQEDDILVKNADLNQTFVVSSSQTPQPKLSPSSSAAFQQREEECRKSFESSFSKAFPHTTRECRLDFELAMVQPGKKLTLSDLLSVAKDFNSGRIPQVSVDERKRIGGRHRWSCYSFPSVFISQLLLLAVLSKALSPWEALTWFILLVFLLSSYNLFVWKLRYENFKDWRSAFDSVLKDGSWKTQGVENGLSQHYLLPYLFTVLIGSLLVSIMSDYYPISSSPFPTIAVGIIAVASIQFGVLQRILPSWQQVLILCLAVAKYKPQISTTMFGGNLLEQHARILHQPLIPMEVPYQYLPLTTPSVFSAVVLVILLTSLKGTMFGVVRQTFPEVVVSLWLLKIVQLLADSDSQSSALCGVYVSVGVCLVMALVSSKWETWKVVLTLLSAMLILTALQVVVNDQQNPQSMLGSTRLLFGESAQPRFIDWEEYDMKCHKKAWSVQSPAATQIKCSSLYTGSAGGGASESWVKWKGRISMVKVEKLTRSMFDSTILDDVAFDISVGILRSTVDDEQGNWKSFLHGSGDTETLAPASVIVTTYGLRERKRKQHLVDHVLNFRTGDKIEFVGQLNGASAGSLRPQIINVQSVQCLSCATADYEEAIVIESPSLRWNSWIAADSLIVTHATASANVTHSLKDFFLQLYFSIQNMFL